MEKYQAKDQGRDYRRHRRFDPRNTRKPSFNINNQWQCQSKFINNKTNNNSKYRCTCRLTKLFVRKPARYNSYKDFLSRCIQEKFVPKGLQLTLERSIGNYDPEFIDNWYSNLKDFSLILMKQIVTYWPNDRRGNPKSYYRNLSNLKATTKEGRLCRNTQHHQS